MRYYEIIITNPDTGEVIVPKPFKKLGLNVSYTSYINGKTIPGALDVELQVQIYNYAQAKQGSFLRIYGVSLAELASSNDLSGKDITIKVGMKKGLPLAKPSQAGTIIQGRIFQAFGNWQGTEMALNLVLQPPVGQDKPRNLVYLQKADQLMADAIRATLGAGMKEYDLKIAISDRLKFPDEKAGYFTKLADFATMIKQLSTQSQFAGIPVQGGGTYAGVDINIKEKTIFVQDKTVAQSGSSYSSPLQIAFEDIVGQPTWISANQINFKTVMRSDVHVNDYIKLPAGLTTPYILTGQGGALPNAPGRDKLTFSGIFTVRDLYHFGRYRQPDAASWVTVLDATYVIPPGATQ